MNNTTISIRDEQVCLLRNPDGSPRWIWPARLQQPLFLAFYYPGSWRARWMVALLQLVFRLGWQRLFFRPRTMAVPAFVGGGEWAMFTGTAGPGRKTIIAERQADGQMVFHKMPVGEAASEGIARERNALALLHGRQWRTFNVPTALPSVAGVFSQTASPTTGAATDFTRRHAEVIAELFDTHHRTVRASEAFNTIELDTDPRLRGIRLKCQWLQAQLDPQRPYTLGAAHGDFTPWNMAWADAQLYLYDWEMFEPLFPKGFDAFHYLFQQAVLVERLSWPQLKSRLPILLETGVFDNETDLQAYLRAYLITNTQRHLALYARQPQWHPQVYWLLQMWHDAMDDLLQRQVPHSQLFAAGFTDLMGQHPYAALKCDAHSDLLDWGPNQDLDLVIPKSTARKMAAWMQAHPLVGQGWSHRQTHRTALSLAFQDGGLLHFDLLYLVRRKALVFMDTAALVARSHQNAAGLRCAAPADSAAYIALFYALNDAAVPAHHQHWKQALAGTAAPMTNLQLLPLFDNHHAVGGCWYELKQRPENRGLRGTWQQLEYAWDVCASFFRWDGKVVTVSGVDGAGKSTILEDVRLQVEKTMRREVVLLRHRPSLLPILSAWRHGRQAAEHQAAQRLPRQGNNQSMAASLLRFAYYYTDYLLGQWYVFFKYVVRGKVVLYDRYYFDFMADPRRSNLVLPTWLTRAAFAGLLRPDFNFFLYAPAADILRRKAELSEADIQWLTGQYLDVFERLQNQDAGTVYLPIENTDRAKTGRIIFAYLSNALRA